LTPPSRIALALQRIVLRLERKPLRRLLAFAYRGIARATGAYLTRSERDAAVYVRGGVGAGDFQPGLSDIDLAIILPDDPAAGRTAERVKDRWERVARTLPFLQALVDLPRVHEDAELMDLVPSSAFTYGLDDSGSDGRRAGYFGDRSSLDLVRTLERPGLYGATEDWTLLTGPDRRSLEPGRDSQARRIAGWLELVWTWRAAFLTIAEPSMPRTADACVKLVADPARIWLWLADGERASGRADAIRRALWRIPEEEPALRRALELHRALPRLPRAPLAELLPAALRLSARVAALIGDQIVDAGTTELRLAGDSSELVTLGHVRQAREHQRVLALADWRAVAAPELPDESFALWRGDPRDPAVLAEAVNRVAGPYPALRFEELMILPAVPLRRSRLRAVKSAVTDPVFFAVAAGKRVAAIPDAKGWSVRDTAHRAVAEHRAWLEYGSGPNEDDAPSSGGHHLGRLLTAARAALLLESVEDEAPELCLTATETARRLAARSTAAGTVVSEALGRYREFALEGGEPPAKVVAAMHELVIRLPGYGARALLPR